MFPMQQTTEKANLHFTLSIGKGEVLNIGVFTRNYKTSLNNRESKLTRWRKLHIDVFDFSKTEVGWDPPNSSSTACPMMHNKFPPQIFHLRLRFPPAPSHCFKLFAPPLTNSVRELRGFHQPVTSHGLLTDHCDRVNPFSHHVGISENLELVRVRESRTIAASPAPRI